MDSQVGHRQVGSGADMGGWPDGSGVRMYGSSGASTEKEKGTSNLTSLAIRITAAVQQVWRAKYRGYLVQYILGERAKEVERILGFWE